MYKKKRWICVAWLLVMMLLLCACGNLETGKNQGEVAENDKIQIGMSFDSFVIERWQPLMPFIDEVVMYSSPPSGRILKEAIPSSTIE